MYDKISGARGRYYLYYAPHDAPGGICLAYGNSLSGPFTEYPANPIISRTWSPHYSVSHVSSPHVLWNASTRQFFMYYHGENTTTRLAISSDGINFTYYGTVLTTAMVPGTTEATYARVFEHRRRAGQQVRHGLHGPHERPADLLGLVQRRQVLAVRPQPARLARPPTGRPT